MLTRAPHAKRPRTFGGTQKNPARERAATRERVAPHPLRFGPNLYIAHTQPGFEAIAADEIATRVGGAREITRRGVPDRAGMTIFFAPAAHKLAALRTVEDLFGLAGYRAGLAQEIQSLEKIRAASRDAPLVEHALQARLKLSPRPPPDPRPH